MGQPVGAAFDAGEAIHASLNLHRAPGCCVNPPKEPLDPWRDPAALGACTAHWAMFARRYKGRLRRERIEPWQALGKGSHRQGPPEARLGVAAAIVRLLT